jgi:glycine/D-amino acid oxidase-like deaminating enzyme/nitrite reductase/ring-hydroxylating ferredoxin subunit
VKSFGEKQARLAWDAGSAAINAIEEIIDSHKIDCQFRRVPGFLHASLDGNRDETKSFKSEAELAQKLGLDVQFVQSVPLVDKPGYRVADQAKFHPTAYLAGLSKLVAGKGSAIFEKSEVTAVEDDPLAVKCGKLRVTCDYVVIATHVPLMGKAGLASATFLQTKLMPYSTYAVGARLARNTLPEMSLWDTSDPYYYLRIDRGPRGDYAIFGGEDHKTGQATDTSANFRRLAQKLKQILPAAIVDHRWSGQVIETNDGLPFIGEIAERQFIATGFSGNGMTLGTLAGLMARDAMLKRKNPWQELFAVGRTKVRGGTWNYLKENVDYPFYYVKDRLTPAEGSSSRAVRAGEGKILKVGGERVACSRDGDGKVHSVSAYCTHMGCLVRWNKAERTWDCPCHGSRFRPNGEVLAGPAETPLEPVKQPRKKKPSVRSEKPRRRRSAAAGKGR